MIQTATTDAGNWNMTLSEATTTTRGRTAPGAAAPEPKRLPGEVPEYLDVYMPDNPVGTRPNPIGTGQRCVLTLEIGTKRSRVLSLTSLAVAWIPSHWLQGGKPMRMAHLPSFIKARRAERHRLGVAVAEEAVRDALELLDGKRVPTRQGTAEEHVIEEADVKLDDDKQGAAEGGAVTSQPAGDGAAAPGAAAQPEGVTEVQPQTETRATRRAAASKKAAPAKAAKPAKQTKAAKPAKEETARVNEARMAQTIKLKKADAKGKPAEPGKYREGPRKDGYDLLKDGETIGAYLKRAEAKGIDRVRALRQLAYYEGDGYVTLKKG